MLNSERKIKKYCDSRSRLYKNIYLLLKYCEWIKIFVSFVALWFSFYLIAFLFLLYRWLKSLYSYRGVFISFMCTDIKDFFSNKSRVYGEEVDWRKR